MQPMDYRIDVKDPFETAIRGVSAGLEIGNAIDKQKLQDAAMQRQTQMHSDLATFAQKQNPTAQDFTAISTKYPELADKMKATWDTLSADQQKNRLDHATLVYSALQSGRPDIAKQLLQDQATAYRNGGMENEAKSTETMQKLVDTNPGFALNSAGMMLSSVLGPEKFASNFSTISKTPGETAQANAAGQKATYEAEQTPERFALEKAKGKAELRNIDSQIGERAGRLALDRDKMQSDIQMRLYELGQKQTTLDADGRKLVNDSTISSVAAAQSAGQMTDLANRLDAAGGGWGGLATASEFFKKATGNQDYMSNLRSEYARIRSNQVMKLLPPGPASDKDVAMAMKGFPPETADSKQIASFLRGMAKLNNYSAAADSAKAEWVNSVGYLGKPKTDIEVDGVKVPAGTTFADFARGYLDRIAAKNEAATAQQSTGSRSYMRWANQ